MVAAIGCLILPTMAAAFQKFKDRFLERLARRFDETVAARIARRWALITVLPVE